MRKTLASGILGIVLACGGCGDYDLGWLNDAEFEIVPVTSPIQENNYSPKENYENNK